MSFESFIPLGKLVDRAIYFTFHNFFLFLSFLMISQRQISQEPLDRFLQSFHRMKAFSGPFFGFLKGRCHGNQLKSKNWHFSDQSTFSRCHSEMDCNITIPISKD